MTKRNLCRLHALSAADVNVRFYSLVFHRAVARENFSARGVNKYEISIFHTQAALISLANDTVFGRKIISSNLSLFLSLIDNRSLIIINIFIISMKKIVSKPIKKTLLCTH